MLPTALVKNEASKGFKGDSDSIKVKSFSSRTSSWLIAELIWGTSHIKISEATWGNLNREISSTSGGGSVVIRLINSDRISGLVKLKKKELNLLIKLLKPNYFWKQRPSSSILLANGKGVLGSLVPFILDIRLACWGSMAILDL